MVKKFPFNGYGGRFIYFGNLKKLNKTKISLVINVTPTASHVPSTTTIPGGSTTIEMSSTSGASSTLPSATGKIT
jgi:hypothetical protein